MTRRIPEAYWDMESRIGHLRRQVLVHSILYYTMDSSVIPDERFDSMGRQLVRLCKEDPEAASNAEYFYCMHDFDGTTGFDLPGRLEEHDREYLEGIARNVLALWKGEKR